MDDEKNNITFNIYGGSNQILPNATKAEQHFYGDQFAKKELGGEDTSEPPLTADECRLIVFIKDVKTMRNYIALLAECEDATAIGHVVAIMCENEPHLDEKRIVKKEFIKTLLPFVPKVERGLGIDNLRVQINQAWAERKRELKHL